MNSKASPASEARPPGKGTPAKGSPATSNRSRWIAAGIAGLVIVAGIVAIVATSGGDDDGGDSSATTGSGPDGSPATTVQLEEMRPVTITGDPLPAFEQPTGDLAIGRPAPQVSGASFDGTPVVIAPGKPTMVVFLSHSCPHCQVEVPRLVEWYESGTFPAGLDVIGVATNTRPDYPNYPPSEWLERENWPWPVLADDDQSSTLAAYGFHAFPTFALLNSDGTVATRFTGEVEIDDLQQIVSTTLGV